MREQFLRVPYNHSIIRKWRIRHLMNSFDVFFIKGFTVYQNNLEILDKFDKNIKIFLIWHFRFDSLTLIDTPTIENDTWKSNNLNLF